MNKDDYLMRLAAVIGTLDQLNPVDAMSIMCVVLDNFALKFNMTTPEFLKMIESLAKDVEKTEGPLPECFKSKVRITLVD